MQMKTTAHFQKALMRRERPVKSRQWQGKHIPDSARCTRCGLRGSHSCLPSIDLFAGARRAWE